MEKFQNRKYVVLIITIIIVLIVINLIPGFNNNLGNFIFKITSPINGFFIKIGNVFSGFFTTLFSIRGLAIENNDLRIQNMKLETEISSLKEIKRRDEALLQAKESLKDLVEIKQVGIVIWKDIQENQDWILINKGKDHGLEKDMAVVSKEGSLVGKIFEVSKDFSKVMLLTNKESVIATLLENGRNEGLIKKEKQGGLFMDFIPRSEKLEIGERIITSGMDNVYPKGILIGKIESIDFSQNQLFQRIVVFPVVDFNKLEEVFIVKWLKCLNQKLKKLKN